MPARHEQRSLFGEILDWMLAPLLLLWPMSVALTWLVAQGIANRPYDRQLGQIANMIAREVREGLGAGLETAPVAGPRDALPRPATAPASGPVALRARTAAAGTASAATADAATTATTAATRATTATTATTASTATPATTAPSATNATSATNPTSAPSATNATSTAPVPPSPPAPATGASALRLAAATAALLRSDEVDRVWFQVRDAEGRVVGGDAELPPAVVDERATPADDVQFRDDTVRNDGVRVAWIVLPALPAATASVPGPTAGRPLAGPLVVQVAETLEKRSRLATEIIKGVILPQFVILPVAVLLVWFALARGIAPLSALQQRIRQRQSQDLSPIDEHDVPEEVAPLVRSINDLLARLDQSMGAQKHFLADAAHQMKTPLAGLRMQADLAQREIDAGGDPQSIKRSLRQIARSSQSAAHLVNQLLSMARAEDDEQARQLQDVGLVRLATEVVRDFVPRALEKRIDLGYEGPEHDPPSPRLRGQPLLVRELIRNLVDNALQYTPAGGTVTVRIGIDPYGGVVVLQVEDTGPGIPAEEREKVFQPFYRALGTNVDGSGLGLAIVKEIADRHGATLTVEAARPPSPASPGDAPGARFTVRFPCPPA